MRHAGKELVTGIEDGGKQHTVGGLREKGEEPVPTIGHVITLRKASLQCLPTGMIGSALVFISCRGHRSCLRFLGEVLLFCCCCRLVCGSSRSPWPCGRQQQEQQQQKSTTPAS